MADPTSKEIFDQMVIHQVELERVSAYFRYIFEEYEDRFFAIFK